MSKPEDTIWAALIHLSYNMWMDRPMPELNYAHHTAMPYMRFDEELWRETLQAMSAAGMNMVLIDLGDAVKYQSHPEIALPDAWTIEHLSKELDYCRSLGLEPIPRLNFSTSHDEWMGIYARMVSTPQYYQVCRDLIREVVDIFGHPRFFHLGMDEETGGHQAHHAYAVMRQWELWWHDLLLLVEEVEKAGARSWVWSDYVWNHPEEFYKRMPKSVLQRNWYYGDSWNLSETYVKAYVDLETHGYDQVPTGSNHSSPDNFMGTVKFCQQNIAPERLKGFLQSIWRVNLWEMRPRFLSAVEQVGEAKRWFDSQPKP